MRQIARPFVDQSLELKSRQVDLGLSEGLGAYDTVHGTVESG